MSRFRTTRFGRVLLHRVLAPGDVMNEADLFPDLVLFKRRPLVSQLLFPFSRLLLQVVVIGLVASLRPQTIR